MRLLIPGLLRTGRGIPHLSAKGLWVHRLQAVLLGLSCLAGSMVRAVIFYETDDPAFHTTAPTGELSDSGWQYQGRWGTFLGTPIAPNYFLTAAHVGGGIGQSFLYQGVNYLTSARFDAPGSDLRIWRVCGTFPAYAPLYRGTNEVGQTGVVIGRGTQRGESVTVTNGSLTQLKGWQWGVRDSVQRWGLNVITEVIDGDDGEATQTLGLLLKAEFNAGAGESECHLSVGDSGGAMFLEAEGVWRLAGIHYAVDGPFRLEAEGESFEAALFDQGGLYRQEDDAWTQVPDRPRDEPTAFYTTRVASNLEWIDSILALPVPPEDQPVLEYAGAVDGTFLTDSEAQVDVDLRLIRTPIPGEDRFYRLRACLPMGLTGAQIEGSDLVFRYELLP